jgi:hypothetical protein
MKAEGLSKGTAGTERYWCMMFPPCITNKKGETNGKTMEYPTRNDN